MLDHAAQSGRHPLAERGNDLYETPVEATRALLDAVPLPSRIREPACGRGAIVNVLRAAGHEVVASDLIDYGIPITAPGYWGVDFLREREAPKGTQAIVTNPPYALATQFAEHAVDLVPEVFLLLRLAFLESARRTDLLEHRGLHRVLIFRKRLPMMHRDGWSGPRASSAIPFAWFCWRRGYESPAAIVRI